MGRKFLRLLLWLAVVFAVIGGLVYVVLDPWTIPGDDAQLGVSIEPTMSVGDLVLVSRAKSAADGALVRCADPDAPGRYVVGRVFGHGGDVIELINGGLLVNGKPAPASIACDVPIVHLKNPATQEDEELHCMLEELGGGLHPVLHVAGRSTEGRELKVDVEQGKVFLISDNRSMHLDSRDFTSVAPSSCQRIAYRLWGASGWLDTKKRLTLLW